MILTSSFPSLAIPEEQAVNGHGLTFSSDSFTLLRSATTHPVGMTGFRDATSNPACPYAYMLNLQFSSNPVNWRVQMQASPFLRTCTTWGGREVGALAGDLFTAQPSNASAALEHHTIRLLVRADAVGFDQLTITLGSAEQASLISANFQRTHAVLHPSPRFGVPRLAPGKKTTPGIDGKIHATLTDPDPLFSGRVHIEAWDDDQDLLDLDSVVPLPSFGMWPSGLTHAFTLTQPIKYRRPDFARNCLVTRTTGIIGADGLDHPGGPAGMRLDFAESI